MNLQTSRLDQLFGSAAQALHERRTNIERLSALESEVREAAADLSLQHVAAKSLALDAATPLEQARAARDQVDQIAFAMDSQRVHRCFAS